jgi:hypothetical protein
MAAETAGEAIPVAEDTLQAEATADLRPERTLGRAAAQAAGYM